MSAYSYIVRTKKLMHQYPTMEEAYAEKERLDPEHQGLAWIEVGMDAGDEFASKLREHVNHEPPFGFSISAKKKDSE